MLEVLDHLLGFVCGQNPNHTWAPGGIPLPCCERCLGLYGGAACAAALLLWLKPSFNGRFLTAHGTLLLLMAPFGFHWLPHGPFIRTMTGIWFGAACVAFLVLPFLARDEGSCDAGLACGPETAAAGIISDPSTTGSNRSSRHRAYGFVLGLALILLPTLAAHGNRPIAYLLSLLVGLGAAVLGGLAIANVLLLLLASCRLQRPSAPAGPPPG
jgi:hypothetical protein